MFKLEINDMDYVFAIAEKTVQYVFLGLKIIFVQDAWAFYRGDY